MMSADNQTRFLNLQRIDQLPAQIDEVEIFRLDTTKPGYLSFGTGDAHQHAALRLCAQGVCGWSEGIISQGDPSFQLAPWGACFSELKAMTVANALMHHRQHRESWWVNQLEMAELALLDLAGRLLDLPVLVLLNLDNRQSVPGLFAILENDPQGAAEKAGLARKQNLAKYVKLKLFGELALDTALVRAVRQVVGPKSYLIGDASESYASVLDVSLDELASQLKTLHRAGLSACIDPAPLETDSWVSLQAMVGLIDLIPDKPLYPAWQARHTVLPGMGRVYNMHPGSMGSLIDTVALARYLQSLGGRVAIGDDNLVGPGCSTWQQIAVGLGAVWIEALDKPQDSDVFLQCIQTKSTERKMDGRFGLIYDHATRDLRPGFGLQVDVPLLRKLCSAYCSI
jgi:L-alanine-DL-glutamate epimerase-like enolase superfamily enzyme